MKKTELRLQAEQLCDTLTERYSIGTKLEVKVGIVWFGETSHAVYVGDKLNQVYESYELLKTVGYLQGIEDSLKFFDQVNKIKTGR